MENLVEEINSGGVKRAKCFQQSKKKRPVKAGR